MHQYFGVRQLTRRFLINALIMSLIIGDMLWDLEDTYGGTHTQG